MIQFSASNPRNFTTADLSILYQMQAWINDMFISLNPPAIPLLNHAEEETTTRIKFNFFEPDFIIDPLLWDYSPYTYPPPISILQYNSNTSPLGDEIIVSGNLSNIGRYRIENSDENDGCYIFVSSVYDPNTNTTKLRLPNNQYFNNLTQFNNGVLYFVPNPSTSYSNAPYTIYHSQIKDRLHIYLVSFSDPCRNDFGFAPGIGFPACYNAFRQPMNPLSYYAAAQLIAHEIGHSLGLHHTAASLSGCSANVFNVPVGITDLPASDCFGWGCGQDPNNNNIVYSNNIMGYNNCRKYLSPLQIAFIRRHLSSDQDKLGRLKACQIFDPTESITITGNVVWDNKEVVGGDLIVETGAALTIQCRVHFPKGARLIVKPGGKLILDGGYLTNACGEHWQGIELQGNPNAPQTAANHATVELKNGAMIEYARFGINTIALDQNGHMDWSNRGGRIITNPNTNNNCTFKDCRKAIQFMEYKNTNLQGNEINNISRIHNCEFITSNDFSNAFPNEYPTSFISLYKVKGVTITGCKFENQRSDLNTLPINQRGNGVYSIDASYNVTARYNLINGNLIANTGNTFNNLFYATGIAGATGPSNCNIKDNVFNNNYAGVFLAASNYGLIANNTFNVPRGDANGFFDHDGTPKIYDNAYGIYSDGAYGFNAEANTFNDLAGTGTEFNHATNVNNSSYVGGGRYYRNNVNGLKKGVQAGGYNGLLKVDCNTFSKAASYTDIDVHVVKTLDPNSNFTGVLADQGLCGSSQIPPANNAFIGACNNGSLAKLYANPGVTNPSNASIKYNYQNGTLNPPTCVGGNFIVTACGPGDLNECLSTLSNPIGDKLTVIEAYKSQVNGLNNELSAKKNLIDGGNTQALLNAIASNMSAGNLKNLLMSKSPYLSDEVLIAYLKKNPPHGHTKEVVMANSPVTQAVKAGIDQMNLPNGISNQINAAQTGVSERALLEAGIHVINTNRVNAIGAIVREYLDTTWIDSAVVYLKQEGSIEAICALVPLQIKRDTTDAKERIADIRYEATCREAINPTCRIAANLKGFCDFHEALMRINTKPGAYFNLTTAERTLLQNIAHQADLAISANALALLNFIDDKVRYLPFQYAMFTQSQWIDATQENTATLQFDISPNPSNGIINISIGMNEETQGSLLLICDVQGRIIQMLTLQNEKITLDLQRQPSGTYNAYIVSKDKIIAHKKIMFVR